MAAILTHGRLQRRAKARLLKSQNRVVGSRILVLSALRAGGHRHRLVHHYSQRM
ncbi:MAG: hypothetical protein ACYDGN_16070 [Acidimicrobiales bacterium]